MALAPVRLPADTLLGLYPDRGGPVRARDFETWAQDDDNPMELIGGWVVPMSPGTFLTGQVVPRLYVALSPIVATRGWSMSLDARHELPGPVETIVYPDLALHTVADVPLRAGTDTATRVPDLVIEILGRETADRDRGPRGAKFRAYELSGVREYYYAWPDGTEATGYRLSAGQFQPLLASAEGFFASGVLGCDLRLVPAALRHSEG